MSENGWRERLAARADSIADLFSAHPDTPVVAVTWTREELADLREATRLGADHGARVDPGTGGRRCVFYDVAGADLTGLPKAEARADAAACGAGGGRCTLPVGARLTALEALARDAYDEAQHAWENSVGSRREFFVREVVAAVAPLLGE